MSRVEPKFCRACGSPLKAVNFRGYVMLECPRRFGWRYWLSMDTTAHTVKATLRDWNPPGAFDDQTGKVR